MNDRILKMVRHILGNLICLVVVRHTLRNFDVTLQSVEIFSTRIKLRPVEEISRKRTSHVLRVPLRIHRISGLEELPLRTYLEGRCEPCPMCDGELWNGVDLLWGQLKRIPHVFEHECRQTEQRLRTLRKHPKVHLSRRRILIILRAKVLLKLIITILLYPPRPLLRPRPPFLNRLEADHIPLRVFHRNIVVAEVHEREVGTLLQLRDLLGDLRNRRRLSLRILWRSHDVVTNRLSEVVEKSIRHEVDLIEQRPSFTCNLVLGLQTCKFLCTWMTHVPLLNILLTKIRHIHNFINKA